jgi:general secretion pathway protein F
MKFSATTLDATGRVAVHSLQATSLADAKKLLGEQGLRLVDIKAAGLWVRGNSVSRAAQLQLCAAVEQVLGAGLTLTEALRAIATDQVGESSRLSEELLDGLQRGLTPSAAFANSQAGWSALLIALLRSGERSGTLPASFKSYVAFETGMAELRARLISASVYPVVLLVASLLVLGFLLGFVVPKFALALEDVRADLPAASAAILASGVWLSEHWAAVLLGLGCAIGGVVLVFVKPLWRQALFRSLTRLPGLRAVAQSMAHAQAFRIVAALVQGGEPLVEAIKVATNSAHGPMVDRLSACERAVAQGKRPSAAFYEAGLTGALGQQMLIAAERSATLGHSLQQLAVQEETRTARTLDRLTTIYGPVLLLLIAVLVAAVVVALYWPLLQLFESVR